MPRECQNVLTIKNYRNSISSRSFPYYQVFISKCENLSDAYIAAEAEKEWNKNNGSNQMNNSDF